MKLISSCLCGLDCKYNGENNYNPEIKKILDEGNCIVLCPEQLGGLTTPRHCHEIIGGDGRDVLNKNAKIVSKSGIDNSNKFIDGALKVLEICKLLKVHTAILQQRSPSCGLGQIYDGTFSGNLTKGNGVLVELLIQNDINVISSAEY